MSDDLGLASRILIFDPDAIEPSHIIATLILMEIGLEPPSRMKTILSNFCENIGWGGDTGACYFIPDENVYLDDPVLTDPCVYFEDDYDEDKCVLSFSELYHYLGVMANRYSELHPEDKFFDDLLAKFRETHQIEEDPHS